VGQYTPSSAPALDRFGLTREIQLQLKRVGCYRGDINGVWSPSVRRSMKAFTDRVNATLPVEQPDIILLAMVQNHQDTACGVRCRAGQGFADDGRCLPNALIAGAAKKHAPPASRSTTLSAAIASPAKVVALSANVKPPAAGRMSLAGPSLPPAGQRYKAARKSSARRAGYAEVGVRKRWRPAATLRVSVASGFPSWAVRAFSNH